VDPKHRCEANPLTWSSTSQTRSALDEPVVHGGKHDQAKERADYEAPRYGPQPRSGTSNLLSGPAHEVSWCQT